LRLIGRASIVDPVRQLLLIAAAIAAVFLLTEFLFAFYDWNQMQACATSGGRGCGGSVPVER